jgi:phage/plasmid-like protein (TIGR03299 family)
MAHELNFTNGTADFFEVGAIRTAWHGFGKHFTTPLTYEEAIIEANLDYEVVKNPTFIQVADGEFIQSRKAFVTRRLDTGAELGSVGDDYAVVQNHEAFEALKPLVDDGLVLIETAGVLREGADAWMLVRWNLDRMSDIVKDIFAAEVLPFSLVSTNHSGRRGILIGDTPVRIVCANTLGAAENGRQSRLVTIRHTDNARKRLVEEAERLWVGVGERYERIAAQYATLKACTLSEEDFNSLVLDVAVPDPSASPKFNPDARTADLVLRRYEEKRITISRLWTEGKGHQGDHSAWEAYNGVVEAIDHNASLWPGKGGAWRAASMMDGVLAQTKNAVLDNLVSFAPEATN